MAVLRKPIGLHSSVKELRGSDVPESQSWRKGCPCKGRDVELGRVVQAQRWQPPHGSVDDFSFKEASVHGVSQGFGIG